MNESWHLNGRDRNERDILHGMGRQPFVPFVDSILVRSSLRKESPLSAKKPLFLQKRHTGVAYIVECAILHMSFGMYAHINEVFMLHMDAAHMLRT